MVKHIRYPLDKETAEFIEKQRKVYGEKMQIKINKTQFSKLRLRPIIIRGLLNER